MMQYQLVYEGTNILVEYNVSYNGEGYYNVAMIDLYDEGYLSDHDNKEMAAKVLAALFDDIEKAIASLSQFEPLPIASPQPTPNRAPMDKVEAAKAIIDAAMLLGEPETITPRIRLLAEAEGYWEDD